MTQEMGLGIQTLQACVGCSLCEYSCVMIQKGDLSEPFSPKRMVQSWCRSWHDKEAFEDQGVPCLSCQKCTVTCPTHVSFQQVAELYFKS